METLTRPSSVLPTHSKDIAIGGAQVQKVTIGDGVSGDLQEARTFTDPATTITLFAEAFRGARGLAPLFQGAAGLAVAPPLLRPLLTPMALSLVCHL